MIGVGFEYGFAPNLSVGFEYDHMFMGSRDVNFFLFNGGFDFNERIRQDVDIFTVRLNYKFGGFGGPVVARYRSRTGLISNASKPRLRPGLFCACCLARRTNRACRALFTAGKALEGRLGPGN